MNKIPAIDSEPTVDEHEEDTVTAMTPSEADDSSSPRDLNSLREIIFGPTIREYNKRFRTITVLRHI